MTHDLMTRAKKLLEEAQASKTSEDLIDRLWNARRAIQNSPAFETLEGLQLHRDLHEQWMRHRY